jgi:hypothetical protein
MLVTASKYQTELGSLVGQKAEQLPNYELQKAIAV